jgi:hypothetical protein
LIAQQEIDIHEFIETEFARSVFIDEHIDIGIRPGLIAGVRAKQIKSCRAASSNRWLGGLQLRYDFCFAMISARRIDLFYLGSAVLAS